MYKTPRHVALLLGLGIAAVAVVLSACGMAQPSMGYQGVLTNPEGTPVPDGTYEMVFRLYEAQYNIQGTPQPPTQVFTQTSQVTVNDGLFQVALGSSDNRLPIDKMGRELYLEVAAEGETMSPQMPLYGAPYAFSLYPGAVISDTTMDNSFAALTIGKSDAGTPFPALKLDGSLQSSKTSYLWVPASEGHEASEMNNLGEFYYYGGGLYLHRLGGAGGATFVIPVQVPGILYGQAVTLDSVQVFYRCTGDCGTGQTAITNTHVYKMTHAASQSDVATDTSDHFDSTADGSSYTLADIGQVLDGEGLGIIGVRVDMNFFDTSDRIYLAGLRVGLKHQ